MERGGAEGEPGVGERGQMAQLAPLPCVARRPSPEHSRSETAASPHPGLTAAGAAAPGKRFIVGAAM